jgi:ATPase subunit of ABC transporter with duplicated ATPase domains
MPILQANNISYQLENGDMLFQNISSSLTERKVGLVGRNGIGKSVLASLLSKELDPSHGSITLNGKVSIFKQTSLERNNEDLTIAHYLQVDNALHALEQVSLGSCDDKYFDLIGEQWNLQETLTKQLFDLGLPENLFFPLHLLSGGQLARLQLWNLFKIESELLILDEPSNHLDEEGTRWLIDQINHFNGYVLLISHDSQLLNNMDHIWELTSLGLNEYGGNFDFYFQQRSLETQAVARQIKSIQHQQKNLLMQTQKNKEKAQQRASNGHKNRRNGSQPKVLLDAKRDSATASISNRLKNEKLRNKYLEIKSNELNAKNELINTQKIYLQSNKPLGKSLVKIRKGVLPYGTKNKLDVCINDNTKLHLKGENGSGKSTLLNVLLGKAILDDGEIQVNTSFYYLDQHFTLIYVQSSVLDNVLTLCPNVLETDARVLLAGIGFRKDSVYRLVDHLSGGEKMKLAMLVVSHQERQPLLLLDEPDNHLDIESKFLLAETLSSYNGAYILVSHDKSFVKKCGLTNELKL